jgi:hypothetical protein
VDWHYAFVELSRSCVVTKKFACAVTLAVTTILSGCVAAPTWTNRGHQVVEAKKSGLISCAGDAQIVDGKRIQAGMCGAPVSGWMGDGEPKIEFGPWNMRLIIALASETTKGVEKEYDGKKYFLRCSPTFNTDKSVEVGRDCEATVDGQPLMSVEFVFK